MDFDFELLGRQIQAGAARILSHQREDGGFSYFCELSPLTDAIMVIFLHLVGNSDDPLVGELSETITQAQTPEGSWVAYPDQTGNASLTTLCYFALKLSHYEMDSGSEDRARQFILDHGGIRHTSNLTKIVLACAGQLSWRELPPPFIDFVLWGEHAPVDIYDFASFTRLHMIPFMLLSHLDFHVDLPAEVGVKDLVTPSFSVPHIRIPFEHQRAVDAAREFILDRLEENGTLASYHFATVLAVLALIAIGEEADREVIETAIQGLKEMAHRHGSYVHQQQFTSTVWDTALSMRALQATRLPMCNEALERGFAYLINQQHVDAGDWQVHLPKVKPGGWGFSDINTLYPDVDDTVAVLKVIHPFQARCRAAWRRGVKWVLAMQNDDGGWSPFDHDCNKAWLEHIPLNDMGKAMTDPSTADITGRVLETIGSTGIRAQSAVTNAVHWLTEHQQSDGSWMGRWGVTFIYGTWAAVRGLRAVGLPRDTPPIQRALAWLEQVQNPDGGFGESCASDQLGSYQPLGYSTASQTAWALMAMMSASSGLSKPILRAVEFLMNSACEEGGWNECYPTGAAVAGQAYIHYHSYREVWPLLALCMYLDRFRRA
ncbi:terpene cyclase/mutase family protein [Alicyclobacillus fastidiosus]|uniref:Prenyltransferase/squalene oxidase repeat-containing protein n=1 Tax=Alicyclobacillus fastidiosus TaxID=392011 RepID=A0ABV5ABL5_9BACL|nr:prenyltransferase/squalene oxidase repeat-containing protein [Alicyclobacillus fastidiosus]WEH10378.1 prenyltransferase/squalene oxidase repeat-containing protein [Alicyclobacillus fastidiosus]